MSVELRPEGDRVLVVASGRLTLEAGAGDLGRALRQVLEAPPLRVEVDLAQVPMLDSASLSELISAERRLAAVGSVLRIVRSSPKMAEILRVTRLDSVFCEPPRLHGRSAPAPAPEV